MTARGLLALAALLLLTACGIQPTGAVPAGEAPGIPDTQGNLPESTNLTLYFLLNGQLYGVARQQRQQSWSIDEAVAELLRGPDEQEQAEGMVTLLPATSAPVVVTGGGTLTISVPFAVRNLPRLALSQLVCTTSALSGTANGPGGIILVGTDGSAGYHEC
jgi:hypothetical protein